MFFTNTDYFSEKQLREFRSVGFKVLQLEVGYEELMKRNTNRVKNEGYEDMSIWLKGMLEYQKQIKEQGFVDEIINGEQPTEAIVKKIRQSLNI